MAFCRRPSVLPVLPLRRRASALVTVMALALALSMTLAPLPRTGGSALAADDGCPEPNNEYQRSCLVPPNTPIRSVLSSPDDADFFRIEVLDFGVTVNVEMAESPKPYRMTIRNWDATILAVADEDDKKALQFKPAAPGSYYVIVDPLYDGPDGVSPEPYTLVYKPVYPGPTPKIAFAADFRQPGREFSGAKDWGNYSAKDGKYQVELLKGGNGEAAAVAAAWWPDSYSDFTMVADVRLAAVGEQAGFAIGFRGQPRDAGETLRDDQTDFRSAYMLMANTATLQMAFLRLADDKPELLIPWRSVRSMRTSDQINHIVVRATGPQIIVNINGEEVVKMSDPALTDGRLILGALSFGQPVTVFYDNLLVTTPQ